MPAQAVSVRVAAIALIALAYLANSSLAETQNEPPEGFVALFNGKDLSGWKGLVGSPPSRAKMSESELAEAQKKADDQMREHWSVDAGVLVFDGKGLSLCTAKDYRNFELYVDWKIKEKGDSGIYLRGSPQVQIWDPAISNDVGSGGLYNNQKHASKPSVQADNPIGAWNTFYIKMVGERVTIKLNDTLVVDNVVLENYWERDKPIYETGQIELQNHGNTLYFRNVYLRELPDDAE
ncbi:MAG: DUF1080 domain-containing protein [Planctomycetota bacterium]|nr:DUF1080 domain-containing protein [Planctomycetota bacterium]